MSGQFEDWKIIAHSRLSDMVDIALAQSQKTDAAVNAEIKTHARLKEENAKLIEACRCFRHFVNMRGGSWVEMLDILNDALKNDDDQNANS